MALLARREHTRAELRFKLAPHAPSDHELDAVLHELQARGWLSDARAAQSLVHRLAPRQGLRRIQQTLGQRGVDPVTAQEVLDGLRQTETERAHAVWAKKFGGAAPHTLAERAKQLRFLLARGFSAEVARRVVPAATQRHMDGAEPTDGDADLPWGEDSGN